MTERSASPRLPAAGPRGEAPGPAAGVRSPRERGKRLWERNPASWILTLGAVVALPAGQAHDVALRRASVVAEAVVPRTAHVGTSRPVVMRVTRHPVLVAHERVCGTVLVRRPGVGHVQPALSGEARHQRLPCEKQSHISLAPCTFRRRWIKDAEEWKGRGGEGRRGRLRERTPPGSLPPLLDRASETQKTGKKVYKHPYGHCNRKDTWRVRFQEGSAAGNSPPVVDDALLCRASTISEKVPWKTNKHTTLSPANAAELNVYTFYY